MPKNAKILNPVNKEGIKRDMRGCLDAVIILCLLTIVGLEELGYGSCYSLIFAIAIICLLESR